MYYTYGVIITSTPPPQWRGKGKQRVEGENKGEEQNGRGGKREGEGEGEGEREGESFGFFLIHASLSCPLSPALPPAQPSPSLTRLLKCYYCARSRTETDRHNPGFKINILYIYAQSFEANLLLSRCSVVSLPVALPTAMISSLVRTGQNFLPALSRR